MTSAATHPSEPDAPVSGEQTSQIEVADHASSVGNGAVNSSAKYPRTVQRKDKKIRPSFSRRSVVKESQQITAEHEEVVDPVDNEVSADAAADPQPETAAATPQREVPLLSIDRARERGRTATKNAVALQVRSLSKSYGGVLAASDVSFEVHAGSFTGVVGPNGAGKTTVLSMVSGLNRPSSGTVTINDIDVWADGLSAKRVIGSLPDRLRLFDRLTGSQLLYYFGVLHGLKEETVASRATELAVAFGLESALDRVVSDYSSGMQKKIGLACAMIHAPEILVLDEPFETIDPVSAATVTDILEKFVLAGGSVVMSSHSLELIQRVCDHVVVISHGHIVANGSVDSVRAGMSLEDRFKALTQSVSTEKGLEWLRASGNFA